MAIAIPLRKDGLNFMIEVTRVDRIETIRKGKLESLSRRDLSCQAKNVEFSFGEDNFRCFQRKMISIQLFLAELVIGCGSRALLFWLRASTLAAYAIGRLA
jgi:hypothetical protein